MINIYSPINSLGYGTHACNMIKALIENGVETNLTTIGQSQIDSYFEMYINEGLKNKDKFDKNNPSLFIFHDEHSDQAVGNPLLTFSVFETTKPKEESLNALNNGPTTGILVTTQKHKEILGSFINKKIHVVNEGIDDCLFNTIPVDKYIDTKKFTYITVGKNEKRKNTSAILTTFMDKMKDKNVALISHTFNMFIHKFSDHPFRNLNCWSEINPLKRGFEYKGFDGKAHKFTHKNCDIYFTLPIIPVSMMSSLYHSANVGIAISRGEGWDLPCFIAGTKVQTLFGWKNIEDITTNDYALTDKGRFKKVNKLYINNIEDKKLFKIDVTGNNIPTFATEEHPILGIKREKVKNTRKGFKFDPTQVEFIKTKDLKKGDFLVKTKFEICNHIEEFDIFSLDNSLEKTNKQVWYKTGFNNKGEQIKINRFIDIKKCSYILGLFLAEGSFDGNKVTISLHSKEKDIAEKFVKDISSIFGYSTNWFKQYGNKFYIEFGSKIIGKFFEYFCGNGSHNKEIRYQNGYNLITSSIAKDILDAAFIGDGHITKTNWKKYTTVSEKFALQYQSVLQNLGFTPILQKQYRKDKNSIEFTISWLEDKTRKHSRKMWFNETIGTIITIKSIKEEEYNDNVYNIEVEEDNTYQLSSFTAHNCTEMLACGVPTISTDCLGHSEYLEHPSIPEIQNSLYIKSFATEAAVDGIWFKGTQGDWDILDCDAFEGSLLETWENQQKYMNKSDELADFMSQNFSWNKSIKTLLEIIDQYK